MNLGNNIQYLRKQQKITQEQLAEKIGVSRQTISRWEAEEAVPELIKLVELCDIFSCKLDALVRQDLTNHGEIYSPVIICRVSPFRMARYVIISVNPEDDVQHYLTEWARKCGLTEAHPHARMIGWDFPFVSVELQNRFGMRGYGAAWVLPERFETDAAGVEYASQPEADYAVITIREPFIAPFERIPNAYQRIMRHMEEKGFKHKEQDNILSCFEHEYERDGVVFMDVYIHVDSVKKADGFMNFSK